MSHDKMHILGKYRKIIALLLVALFFSVAYAILKTTDPIHLGVALAGSVLLAIIATTEAFIRAAMAAVPGGIAAGIGFYVAHHISEGDKNISSGVAFLGGVVSFALAHMKLKNSSWIGVRCPQCSVRGKLEESVIGKEFLGSESKWCDMRRKNRTFHKYFITKLHECSACGHSWQTTHEKREEV